jgi:hypothetical protein
VYKGLYIDVEEDRTRVLYRLRLKLSFKTKKHKNIFRKVLIKDIVISRNTLNPNKNI